MQLYLSVTPDLYRRAKTFCPRLAHAAYRIGPQSHLQRQALLLETKGGILSLSDRGAPPVSIPERLCREILQECCQRRFSGVLADFEERLTADRLTFLRQLQSLLQKNKRMLYLPENIACRVSGSTAVICTALSGGTLKERLEEAAERFGAEHLALDIQRLSMDFPLPCPSGEGTPLSREQLRRQMEQCRPLSFYSTELAARYFTYREKDAHHFVLYDDAHTIREKIRLGSGMGIPTAFLMYPEVEDLLEELFTK